MEFSWGLALGFLIFLFRYGHSLQTVSKGEAATAFI